MDADIPSDQRLEYTGNVGIARALKSPSVAYLKPVLGTILPKALTEICEKRPPDPIEYLARYLYQWADCELYYYEKAIFAKELQLLALQIEKETSRRLTRTDALKRETNALKYLTSNKKALVTFLSQKNLSKVSLIFSKKKDSAFEMEMQAWARDNVTDDRLSMSRTSATSVGHVSSTMHASLAAKRRLTIGEAEERRRRKRLSGVSGMDDYDSSSASRPSSTRRRGRKYVVDEEGELSGNISRGRSGRSSRQGQGHGPGGYGPGGHGPGGYGPGGYGPGGYSPGGYSPGGYRKGRKSKSRKGKTPGDESEDDLYDAFADVYGADAKLKFGFEVTPVRCTWYLAEPNILVCVHPVLGEIRAAIPTRTPLSNTPEWWERNQYKFEVMYDHEIYTHPSPHFDDNKYQDMMIEWEDDEVQEEEYMKEGGEHYAEDD